MKLRFAILRAHKGEGATRVGDLPAVSRHFFDRSGHQCRYSLFLLTLVSLKWRAQFLTHSGAWRRWRLVYNPFGVFYRSIHLYRDDTLNSSHACETRRMSENHPNTRDPAKMCSLCSAPLTKLLFEVQGYPIAKCTTCDLVQVGQSVASEELTDVYREDYFTSLKYSDRNALEKEHVRRLTLLKKKLPSSSATILDFGCAGGDFINYSRSHYQTWGYDVSHHAIKTAQAKNPDVAHRLFHEEGEVYPFDQSFFDAIALWDVIEHLENPLRTLTALSAMLKPQGYFFISTPNVGTFLARILRQYWAFMTPPEHLHFFSRPSLDYLCHNCLHLHLVDWSSKGKWVNLGFSSINCVESPRNASRYPCCVSFRRHF